VGAGASVGVGAEVGVGVGAKVGDGSGAGIGADVGAEVVVDGEQKVLMYPGMPVQFFKWAEFGVLTAWQYRQTALKQPTPPLTHARSVVIRIPASQSPSDTFDVHSSVPDSCIAALLTISALFATPPGVMGVSGFVTMISLAESIDVQSSSWLDGCLGCRAVPARAVDAPIPTVTARHVCDDADADGGVR